MYFLIKTIILVALIVVIFVPNEETVVPTITIEAPECLKKMNDSNIFITLVFAIKWLYSVFRLRIFYKSRKETALQVSRMRNEISRNIRFEQYGPNMLVIIALIYGTVAYYSI